ncbi:MAG: glycosyltransferase [Candidatus Thiothrix sulfatifontis]|nr:MAG: glycosyltransferase [Candidatus Thiothrix sulfatifontis]
MKTSNSYYCNVAVIMAAYNDETYINSQINSIESQINVTPTIFISLDKSPDSIQSHIKKLALLKDSIKLLPYGDIFGGAAPNFFRLISDVDFSEFNYIAFADQDDIWYPDKLSRAIQMLTKYNCDGYSSNFTAFWPDGRKKLINKAQPQVEWDYLFQSPGPGCTFVLTKKLAIELQAFVRDNKEPMSSVWLHDWFIYAFARSHNYKWYIDKYSSMLYRQHENNQVGVNTGYKAFLYRMRFVLSGKALEQSVLLARLCGLASHPFVNRWCDLSRSDFLYLAFNAYNCRRKPSEKILFLLSCLLLSVIGHKKP